MLLGILALAPAIPQAARATGTTSRYDIPAQDMVNALAIYSDQSRQQVAFDAEALRGKKSHAVQGTLSRDSALAQLLEGTGLTYEQVTPALLRILPAPLHPARSQAVPLPPAEERYEPPTVYIVGARQALQSAQVQKRLAPDIREVVVAEDISKLPDANLAEGLQRVSGVQITRDLGEGDQIAVRGLTQVGVRLNGRQISSDTHRGVDIGTLTTDGFSQIEVLKNPHANEIEGGVGGVVDLRTWQPFDFRGRALNLTMRDNYYDLAGRTRIQASLLASTRFAFAGGEAGILVQAASDPSALRLDSIGVEPFTAQTGYRQAGNSGQDQWPAAGRTVLAPHGAGDSLNVADRKRASASLVAQWRRAGLQVKFESDSYLFDSRQDSLVVYANNGPMLLDVGRGQVGSDGTYIVRSGTFSDIAVTVPNNFWDWKQRLRQTAISARYVTDNGSSLAVDLSDTASRRSYAYGGVRLGTAGGSQLTFDLDGNHPALGLIGPGAQLPDTWRVQDAGNWQQATHSDQRAFQMDAHQIGGEGAVKSVDWGIRLSGQTIDSIEGGRSHLPDTGAAAEVLSPLPMTIDAFFATGSDTQLFTDGVLGLSSAQVRDTDTICRRLGDLQCKTVMDASKAYRGLERTTAAYSQVNFGIRLADRQVTGSIGGRYVETALTLDGAESDGGQTRSLEVRSKYTFFLPSIEIGTHLSRSIRLRLAGGVQISKPDFDLLSPNLAVGYTGLNGSPVGTAGNPELRPLVARSWDLSLERYDEGGGLEYITLFSKRVSGFIQNVIIDEPVDIVAATIPVSRPRNGATGSVGGLEAGFQTFLQGFPTPAGGVGVQANFTYTLSDAPSPLVDTTLPLLGLSRKSGNATVFYESPHVYARLAYSYRSGFLETTSGVGSGFSAIYDKPFGTLDASVAWKLNRQFQIRLDWANILRPTMRSYFGGEAQPRFYSIYDERFGVTLRYRL